MTTLQTDPTLVLISSSPNDPIAHHALRYCSTFCSAADPNNLAVFFYAEGASTANRLNWTVADQTNLTHEWTQLAAEFQLKLSVCVSTALARGVSDVSNAQRHQMQGDNLAEGFELVGLGMLADIMRSHKKVIQF